MLQRIISNIKRIVFLITASFILRSLILDFNNFNLNNNQVYIYKDSTIISDIQSNADIVGVKYIPEDVVVNIINNDNYDKRYDLLLKDLKIITLSNESKLILILEDVPIFYDKKYIYLSSGNKVNNDLNILEKEKLAFIDLDIIYDNKKAYAQAVKKIQKFISYLKKNYNDFYNKLESVVYSSNRGDNSPHISLSIFIDGCQIVLSDESGSLVDLKQIEFENKINILNNILNQQSKQINEISEIDLRYSKYDEVFFN